MTSPNAGAFFDPDPEVDELAERIRVSILPKLLNNDLRLSRIEEKRGLRIAEINATARKLSLSKARTAILARTKLALLKRSGWSAPPDEIKRAVRFADEIEEAT